MDLGARCGRSGTGRADGDLLDADAYRQAVCDPVIASAVAEEEHTALSGG